MPETPARHVDSAAGALDIDPTKSFMVGDRWRDIDCGFGVGCKTILVDWGYQEALKQPPDYRVESLLEAAKLIEKLTTSTSYLRPA